MKLPKSSFAGSLQSNDCLINLEPADSIEIRLKSPVLYEFGDQIKEVVEKTLKEQDITGARVLIEDKGALDCTIEARLITAIRRAL